MSFATILHLLFASIFAVFGIATEPQKDSKALYQELLKQFPDASLPYNIGIDNIQAFNEAKSISKKFYGVINESGYTDFGRFSRREEYAAVAKIRLSPRHHALVYAVRYEKIDGFSEQHTILSVMNENGEEVAKNAFSNYDSPMYAISATLTENLVIKRTEHQFVWEKDVYEFGFADNKVVSSTTQDAPSYKIGKNGAIEEYKETSAP